MLYQINHDLAGRKLWCGPGAIALVTGLPTSLIYAHADAERRSRGGKRGVEGMYPTELWAVLRACGYRVTEVFNARGDGLTLRQFSRSKGALFADRPAIIQVGNHFGVVVGRRYVDNQTGDPIYIGDSKYLRSFVTAAWVVERVSGPLPAPVKPEKVRDTTVDRVRRQAQALAKKHGINIEREDRDAFWVTCPALAHDDPHEGAHFGSDWTEVLSMVEDYVKCLTEGYLEAVTQPLDTPPPPAFCPEKPAEAVDYVIRTLGADTPVGIACSLSLLYGRSITYRQVQGAAITLIQRGKARWFGTKLKPMEATA
jgi:hypothetical protein